LSDVSNVYLNLHPADPAWVPDDIATLTRRLEQIGFIGNRQSPHQYSTGPSFLELVTYLGCSPQITLGESDAATVIRFSGPHSTPKFRSSRSIKPRCTACRKSFGLEEMPRQPDEVIGCPHCGESYKAAKLDWRRKAGWGRFFIEISNVFESEAVPGETLLDELGSATGQAWEYFYWQDN
jgi:DNA-directed RNA polymerase subunit RPC12/RpoP